MLRQLSNIFLVKRSGLLGCRFHTGKEGSSRRINLFHNRQFCWEGKYAKMTTESTILDKIANVDIDPQGRFKYILVKIYVEDKSATEDQEIFKYVVRGYASCEYHGDIYDRLSASLARVGGLESECVGGGRILHEVKKLTVFGYSQGFGRADHSKTVEILKSAYPDYEINWNNDGY